MLFLFQAAQAEPMLKIMLGLNQSAYLVDPCWVVILASGAAAAAATKASWQR